MVIYPNPFLIVPFQLAVIIGEEVFFGCTFIHEPVCAVEDSDFSLRADSLGCNQLRLVSLSFFLGGRLVH